MTFKEWLTSYLPDYDSEYSGTLAGLEDAWNAAIDSINRACPDIHYPVESHKSTEFRKAYEGH